jgi:hypothetical protein
LALLALARRAPLSRALLSEEQSVRLLAR